jgi:histidine kinase
LDIHPVELSGVIQTVTRRVQYQFDAKSVTLTSRLPSDPIRILADEDRLVQIITNLIGNALQYTNEKGTVTIFAESDRNEARISVHDSGVGIPPEHLTRIFERFFRVEKSRTRARGGSGIGLTIAKHLVEAQGGRIWAESAGENKGSVFVFTLPLAK